MVRGITCQHRSADSDLPEKINGKHIAQLCAEDWGIYMTFTINLNKILTYLDKLADDEMREHTKKQCKSLLQIIETTPKSMKWKMRARVGEKKRW
jgi:hypothetical protein